MDVVEKRHERGNLGNLNGLIPWYPPRFSSKNCKPRRHLESKFLQETWFLLIIFVFEAKVFSLKKL
jgi:hypothetical protein